MRVWRQEGASHEAGWQRYTWAPELRDLALNIACASENQDVEADLRKAVTLANQMLNGIDIDGNESVDPVAGEGGAITAFEHAEYLSDMPILPGEDKVPLSD